MSARDWINQLHAAECSCGRTYTYRAWSRLPLDGLQGDSVEIIELRTCPCGSTMGRPVSRGDLTAEQLAAVDATGRWVP